MSEEGIRESTRQTLLTLWNVFSFHVTYADLDGWAPSATSDPTPTHVLDRWVLGELDDTVAEVTAALDDFDALGAATRLARFVDDLSNWYVRRSRPRFWKSSDPAAHATLHECLVTTARLLAPFCPFLAEELHTTLTGERVGATWPTGPSRAVAPMPRPRPRWPAPAGWSRSAGPARTDAKMKVRQPLRRALVLHPGVALDDELKAEVASELNVKSWRTSTPCPGLMSWTVVPNFRALGPRLGPKVNEVKARAGDGRRLRAAPPARRAGVDRDRR